MSDASADTATTTPPVTAPATTTTVDTPPPAPSTVTETEVDWKAEAEKYQALHKKQEARAKANADAAKELDRIRTEGMTDLERAIDAARKETRADTLKEVGSGRVDDAVKVAAAGRTVDVEALLEGLDRTRFLTDAHEPDTVAIAAWIDRVVPQGDQPTPPAWGDLGQGPRSGQTTIPGPIDPMEAELRKAVGA